MWKLQTENETNQHAPNMWLSQIWEDSEAITHSHTGERKILIGGKKREEYEENNNLKKEKKALRNMLAKAVTPPPPLPTHTHTHIYIH